MKLIPKHNQTRISKSNLRRSRGKDQFPGCGKSKLRKKREREWKEGRKKKKESEGRKDRNKMKEGTQGQSHQDWERDLGCMHASRENKSNWEAGISTDGAEVTKDGLFERLLLFSENFQIGRRFLEEQRGAAQKLISPPLLELMQFSSAPWGSVSRCPSLWTRLAPELDKRAADKWRKFALSFSCVLVSQCVDPMCQRQLKRTRYVTLKQVSHPLHHPPSKASLWINSLSQERSDRKKRKRANQPSLVNEMSLTDCYKSTWESPSFSLSLYVPFHSLSSTLSFFPPLSSLILSPVFLLCLKK